MALIVEVNKAVDVMKYINNNQESKAAQILGIACKGAVTGDANDTPCILSRVCDIAKKNLPLHTNNSVLVDASSKTINSRDIVDSAMDLMYTLTESVSLCVANTINTLSILSEEDNEEVRAALIMQSDKDGSDTVRGAIIDSDKGIDNLKGAYKDGIITSKDALIDLFAETTKLHLTIKDKVKDRIGGDSSKIAYVDLISNAISGAGILYALFKLQNFNDASKNDINECINSANVINRADDIMYSALSLQENMIKLYRDLKGLNSTVVRILETAEPIQDLGNSGDPIIDGCSFLTTAINTCARELSNLSSSNMIEKYNLAMSAIAALYDEYLLDFCEGGEVETLTTDTTPSDVEEA